jgi:hypothetical protein
MVVGHALLYDVSPKTGQFETTGGPLLTFPRKSTQRRTTVSPRSMLRQTSLTGNPWSFTMRTTSNLKPVSNSLRTRVSSS